MTGKTILALAVFIFLAGLSHAQEVDLLWPGLAAKATAVAASKSAVSPTPAPEPTPCPQVPLSDLIGEEGVCRPLVFTASSIQGNPASDLPASFVGWLDYRRKMLGVYPKRWPCPADEHQPAIWNDRAAIGFSYVDPEWVDQAGLVQRALGNHDWKPMCSWEKVKDWVLAMACAPDRATWADCRRFAGSCAILSTTATWAAKETCDASGCRYNCVGYAAVKAIEVKGAP